jgi:hypothetical protein
MDSDLVELGKIVMKVQEQLSEVTGQSLALMSAVTALVMTHPEPEEFAKRFRSMADKLTLPDEVARMQKGVDDVVQAISLGIEHARGR